MMRLPIPTHAFFAFTRCLGLLIGLTLAIQVTAAPIITSAASNTCNLAPPVMTPSATTVVVGTNVSITVTGCSGGIIQYFGASGVSTIAPGTAINIPTSTTGTVVVPTACSFNGCLSDVSESVITIVPAGDPNQNIRPAVATPIGTQTATAGASFVYVVPNTTFSDPQNDQLTLTATGLPDGVSFNGLLFNGAPSAAGSYQITVTATNSKGLTANTTFSLNVGANAAITPPDLTASQILSSAQIGAGQTIDVVVALRNVSVTPTSGEVKFSVTNYIASTGLTVTINTDPTVTVGGTTYTLNTSDFTTSSTQFAFTFTTTASIAASGSKLVAFKITRSADSQAGSVTSTVTIPDGTGGGETPVNNNTIANVFNKP